MKLITMTVNGKRVEFVCDSRNTRHGFAHDASMFVDGRHESKGHCYYLNRTWESWTYQSACLTAANNAESYWTDRLLQAFKWTHGIKRMTAKRREEFEKELNENEDIKLYRAIIDDLRKNSY